MSRPNVSAQAQWVQWLAGYGAARFYADFLRIAQDAESQCVLCRSLIYLDIAEGGGIPDWRTADGDYGCLESPDTSEEGTGSHVPRKLPA
jgi:hypothetical protein